MLDFPSWLNPPDAESMAKRLAELRAQGIDIINFGMGDPDVPTPEYLLDALSDAVSVERTERVQRLEDEEVESAAEDFGLVGAHRFL